MITKRNLTLLVIGVFAVMVFTAPWSIIANEGNDDGSLCNPAGVYVSPDVTRTITLTIIANDPAANDLTAVIEYADADHTVFGMFPDADSKVNDVGNAVKTGENTYDITCVNYGTKSADGIIGRPVYIWVSSGELSFTADCGWAKFKGTHALFSNDQDKNPRDGVPDEGQTPVWSVAVESWWKRVPILPSYPPTPEGQ